MTRVIRADDEFAIGRDVPAPENLRLQPSVENCLRGPAYCKTPEPLKRRWQARNVRLGELRIRRHPRTSVAAGLSGEELQVRDGAKVANFFRRDIAARA